MSIRTFQPADLPAVMRLEWASFGPDAYDEADFQDVARRWPDLFLVAEPATTATAGGLAGYASAAIVGRYGEIVSIAVDPALRGTGLGRRLFAQLLAKLRRQGVNRVLLMVDVNNEPAQRLYRSFGFAKTRRVRHYYGPGRDAFAMRLWFILKPKPTP